MTRSLHVAALAYRAVLRAPEPLASVLDECLVGLISDFLDVEADEAIDLLPVGDGRWTMELSSHSATDMRRDRPGRLMARLLEHLNRAAAMSVSEAIPFHAAAIAGPDGRVVLLAGPSGSGKSTLCAAAVTHGWKLVAEEVAAVEPESHAVRPYHRPIGLRPGGAAAVGVVPPEAPFFDEVYPWCPAAAALGEGGRLAKIAVVTRNGTVTDSSILAPALALTELIRHVVIPDDEQVATGFHRVADLVRTVPVVRLGYDQPAEGLAALDRLL